MKRLVVGLLLLLTPIPSAGQSAARLTDLARKQIEDLNGDSAHALLATALRDRNVTTTERLRAFTLLAFAELLRENQSGARQAFVQALRIDPAIRIDSLSELHSDAPQLLAEVRTTLGPIVRGSADAVRAPFALNVDIPNDTSLAAADPRLLIGLRPSARARIISTIAPAERPGSPIWADTATTTARQVVMWSLVRTDSVVVASGRYVLRLTATDSASQTSSIIERLLLVSRAVADTQRHPPPLAANAFAPETLRAGGRSPFLLVGGASLAAMIVAIPMTMGNPDLNNGLTADASSYAVAGGIALTSVVGFVKGRPTILSAPNIERNRLLRESDRRRREEIRRTNADLVARAPIRVTTQAAP
jgi:hypothetical protein